MLSTCLLVDKISEYISFMRIGTCLTSSPAMLISFNADLDSSFPTPMDEPKKLINCHYLGTIQVPMATGLFIIKHRINTVYGISGCPYDLCSQGMDKKYANDYLVI